MAKFMTPYSLGRQVPPYGDGADVVAQRFDFSVANPMIDSNGNSVANFTTNDVIHMFDLPAGHVIDDVVLVTDRLDTGSGCSLAVGVLNATDNGISAVAQDGGGAWIADATSCRAAGGGVVRPTLVNAYRTALPLNALSMPSADIKRRVGVHIVAAPATLAAGTLSIIVRSRTAGPSLN